MRSVQAFSHKHRKEGDKEKMAKHKRRFFSCARSNAGRWEGGIHGGNPSGAKEKLIDSQLYLGGTQSALAYRVRHSCCEGSTEDNTPIDKINMFLPFDSKERGEHAGTKWVEEAGPDRPREYNWRWVFGM